MIVQYIYLMWLRQCHVYHLPVITIFIGGINHSQSWVVYGIVLTTLYLHIYIYLYLYIYIPYYYPIIYLFTLK